MIFAIARRPFEPKIEMDDFFIAEKIVTTVIDFITELIETHIGITLHTVIPI